MANVLTAAEQEQLRLIADALQRNVSLQADEEVLGALIRKCMIRTMGKTLKLTEQGRRQLQS